MSPLSRIYSSCSKLLLVIQRNAFTSSPLIPSHHIMRKDAWKVWSRAPSGDESRVLAAAQLQPWRHHCQTTGSVQTCAFTWTNKTIVGLHCVHVCDGIHQDLDFPESRRLGFPSSLSQCGSFALVVYWLILLVQPHRCESQRSGRHTRAQGSSFWCDSKVPSRSKANA